MTEPLRIGVIGVGVMGADHAERVARRIGGVRLAAVSDPDTARCADVAGRLGTAATVDWGELIATVDAVIIASPGAAHAEQVLACLDAGKPVLCEKPLTLDPASALELVEAQHKLGRELIQVGFMRRFDPEYAALGGRLGDLGRLLMVHHVHRNKAAPDGFRSEMLVRDSLVHEVDVTRWLFGDEITRITVHTPLASSSAPSGVADPQFAVLELRSGAIADVEVFVNSNLGYEVRCEAVAERGTATVGLGSGPVVRTDGRWGGAVPDDYRVRFATAYDVQVQRWADAARRGEVDGPTAWDGYAAVAVCEAGVQSLRSGGPVLVDLADRNDILS